MEETEEKKKKRHQDLPRISARRWRQFKPLACGGCIQQFSTNATCLFQPYTHLYSHQIRQAFHVEMSQERFSHPIYRQALAKEFEIGQQLEHPNICRTIDLEKVDNLGTVVVMGIY